MRGELRNVIGSRGESIAELCLTDYRSFTRPLFRPGFLDGKWPTIDLYVELMAYRKKQLYFFCQVKATTTKLRATSTYLTVSTKSRDIERLLRIPGPTYILGVHEPTMRVFIRSVHTGMRNKTITRIPLTHELTSANLVKLRDEVRSFWAKSGHKPTSSVFA